MIILIRDSALAEGMVNDKSKRPLEGADLTPKMYDFPSKVPESEVLRRIMGYLDHAPVGFEEACIVKEVLNRAIERVLREEESRT